MTQKLYDTDSYAVEFDAKVLSCTQCDKGYEIILDQTLFFPEEGGQCCDKGILGGTQVTDVQLDGDTVYHYCNSPLEAGSTVRGAIDFDLRFRNMQNHTGEHIICGIAHKLYGYENVGFHLGDDCVTMDLDGPLDKEQIAQIEYLANEAVFRNVPVTAYYPDQSELDSIPYRCKADIQGKVRIVTVEGYDICACCAPHVANTGEVGLIKILDFFPHRGGVRLSIVCGFDALCDYRRRYLHTLAISNMLSVKQNEVSDGVQKLLDTMGKLRHEISERTKKIAAIYIGTLTDTEGNICIFDSSLDRDAMRNIVNEGMKKTKGIIGVFSGDDTQGYSYIMGSKNINLSELSKEINSYFAGRGGGSETMIQGSITASEEQIRAFMSK